MINHSFAVMAYKDSCYLSACLDSLKSQTVSSEIYIATSTPSNYIFEIAKKYQMEVFVTAPNKGIAHDWTFALLKAKTKYVTLAHQDDIYENAYTAYCVHAAEKFNDSLICFTGYTELINKIERTNNLLLKIKRFILWLFMPFRKNMYRKFWKKLLLSTGCPIPAPSVMYNIENLNGFRFSNDFSINMDWDAWFRMAKMNGRFIYVPKVLLKHRIHASSATTSGLKNNIRQTEDLKMFKRFWPGFIAKIFARLYAWSYKSNEQKRDS